METNSSSYLQSREVETVLAAASLPELSREEILRYSRHLLLPEVTIEGQQRLKAGRVLLVGTGGLGSPLGLYLGAAGVGKLGLVDFDVVDVTNLCRFRLVVRFLKKVVGRKANDFKALILIFTIQ